MYALILLIALAACASPSEPAPPAGGTGGEGGGAPTACDDLSASGTCRYQGLGGGCDEAQVCTVDLAIGCGDRRCCTLPVGCAAPTGALPGGARCGDDGDCASGLCVQIGGEGVCLRPCEATSHDDSCPTGLQCATVALDDRRSVRTCVGAGEGGAFLPTRSVCRHDADCAEGRYCLVTNGARLLYGGASGLCEPGARTPRAELALCEDGEGTPPRWDDQGTSGSALCPESGLCLEADLERTSPLGDCSPERQLDLACRQHVCSVPCRADEECPSPFQCRRLEADYYDVFPGDLELRFCLLQPSALPEWPCWDQLDCCAGGQTRDGSICCDKRDETCTGAIHETTHCRLRLDRGDRWTSMCGDPLGLAALGAACAAHADCESQLCAPDGTCASPCSLTQPALDGCGTIQPGTQCCPTTVGEACVPACRSDCATGPTCTR